MADKLTTSGGIIEGPDRKLPPMYAHTEGGITEAYTVREGEKARRGDLLLWSEETGWLPYERH